MIRQTVAAILFFLALIQPAQAADQVDRLVELARTVDLARFIEGRADWDADYSISSGEALVMTDLGFAAGRVLGSIPGLSGPFCRAHHMQILAAEAQGQGVKSSIELWTTFFSLEPKKEAPFLSADITFSQNSGKALTLTFTVPGEGLSSVHEYFANRLGDAEAVLPLKTDFRGKPHPELREPGYCIVRGGPAEKLLHYHFPLPEMPEVGLNLFTLAFTGAFQEYLATAEALNPGDARGLHQACSAWVEQLNSEYAVVDFDDGLRPSAGDLAADLSGKWRQLGDDAALDLRLDAGEPYVITPSGRRSALLNLRPDGPDAMLAETGEDILLRFERNFHSIVENRYHLVIYTAQDGDMRRAEYFQ